MEKTIAMRIEYRGSTYTSNANTFDEEQEKVLKELCKDLCGNKVGYVEMEINGNFVYFTKSVIQESIITLVYII